MPVELVGKLKKFFTDSTPDNEFKNMSGVEKTGTLAKGVGLYAKNSITNFEATLKHSGYPEELLTQLQEYNPELGTKRTDRSSLDKAINFGGAYEWASNAGVDTKDAEAMAKAYQLWDYISAKNPERKMDAVMDYRENMEGIAQAKIDKNSKDKDIYNVREKAVEFAKKDFGTRQDGSKKGKGFLGELKRPDGKVSTELSIGVNFDGKEQDIPMLVPTLTKQEIDYLLNDGKPTDAVVKKAVEHARKRVKEGKPVFSEN
jgi:hypothetical protein